VKAREGSDSFTRLREAREGSYSFTRLREANKVRHKGEDQGGE
jgi:hypothetical protein